MTSGRPGPPSWLSQPADTTPRHEVLREALRIEEDATHASQTQFESAKSWQLLGWVLGIPAAGLAAAAGVTGLSSAAGRIPAAILALVAATVGGVLASLEPNRKAERRRSAGVAYDEVRVELRQFRLLDLPVMDDVQAAARLKVITGQKLKIDKAADLPSARAFGRALTNLAQGRLTHEVDLVDDQPAAKQ